MIKCCSILSALLLLLEFLYLWMCKENFFFIICKESAENKKMKNKLPVLEILTNFYLHPKNQQFLNGFISDIKVIDIFPRSIFGFGHALCAYVRMCIAALYICIFLRRTELIFCDSVRIFWFWEEQGKFLLLW